MKCWRLFLAAFLCVITSCKVVSVSELDYKSGDELEEIKDGQDYYEDEQDYYMDDMRLAEIEIYGTQRRYVYIKELLS